MDREHDDSGDANLEPAKPVSKPKTKKRKPRNQSAKSTFDKILKLVKKVPEKEWDRLPTDFSYNVDHYLYGAPKR